MYSNKVTYSTIESAIEALKWCSKHPDYNFFKTMNELLTAGSTPAQINEGCSVILIVGVIIFTILITLAVKKR